MYDDALEELVIAENKPELHSQVLACRLELSIGQERWEEALAAVEALRKLDPSNTGFCIHHAFILREIGRIEGAREVLLGGPEALKKSGTYFYNLGCYEALLDNPGAAIALVKKAFTMSEHLRKFSESDPDLASVREQLADDEFRS
jgi:Flp pilus assembly protein TadD